jgi:hypothetical protein
MAVSAVRIALDHLLSMRGLLVKNVKQIIDLLGGYERLRQEPIHLTVEGFMPLNIEYIGKGPRGGVLLSIMHHFTQHGDLMRDPDLVVEVLVTSDEWLPVSYQQDSVGLYQEAVSVEETGLVVQSRLVDDLNQFMQQWDRNLGEQGFVEAARLLPRQGDEPSPPPATGDDASPGPSG